ncbi:MAG: hypothetical protein HOP18_05675 [Deltaproteobacteria bacterium]|nr:hypothetical protein [Deltaproteobacteria bacterium]
MYKKLCVFTSALLLAAGIGETFAYNTIKCGTLNAKWTSNSYATSASGVGFPVGPWRDALASVVSRWYNNPSNLGFSVSYGDTSVGMGNGQSEVWWTSGFGAPAIANWWLNTSTCRFSEVDIRFDNTVAYHYTTAKGSLWPYGGGSRPFQTTAMHEFGHAAGLGHTASVYSIMGQDWTHIHANGGTATAYPGEDASAGVVAVYGLWASAPQDLGVAHWRRVGASGEYSTHDRTRILNTSGIELARVGTTERTYYVSKGQTVLLEMSLENMGRTSPLVPTVGYYLSTNDTISTGDTFLGSTAYTLYRDSVLTTTRTLVIPSTLISGATYWLGAIIDSTGAIAEGYEGNNATYTAIRVR